MFTLLVRATVVYLIVLVVYRLMGKRQLGQMQPFELVLTLIIADLATIPMTDSAIPVLHGIVPLLTLVTIHFFLTILTRKSDIMNKIISGKPVIVINPFGIDYKAIRSLNLSVDDLFESIRGCGFFSLDEIQYAIVETNGTVNVLAKKDFSPLTVADYFSNSKKEISKPTTIPVTLIAEGKINKSNLETANLTEKELELILKENNIKNIKKILILTIDGQGKIYFQEKNGKYKIYSYNFRKVITWKK